MEKENKSLISVVIATRNEEKNIENCLRSIFNQTYKNVETVVVDKDSMDKTVEIVKSLGVSVFELAKETNLEGVKNFRGAQVNLGVKKSKGKVIFFPDADMTFDPKLFSEAVEKLEEYDALYIPEIVMGKGFMGKIRRFERTFYNETAIDAVRFVKRDVFEKVGGFDEKNIAFSTDDWDLTKMIKKEGFKTGITKKPLFHHEENVSLKTYLNKKSKYTATFDDYINKWGKDDPDIKKQFGIKYRFFEVFFEKGKWIKLLIHPFLTTGMFFLRFLVGATFLSKKIFKK